MTSDYRNTDGSLTILVGDCRERLRELPSGSVQCVVTSPPYWGLRDYGVDGQLGLESTPEEFAETMVSVFREVRRVLRDDGTLWLNLGDSYASSPPGNTTKGVSGKSTLHGIDSDRYRGTLDAGHAKKRNTIVAGLKSKDLVGIPWRVAFALQADGWYLRQDIIWHKPNPMPESVSDRCTKAHEYLFLLSKSPRYYFDADAIREPQETADRSEFYDPANMPEKKTPTWGIDGSQSLKTKGRAPRLLNPAGRNRRSVWTIPTQPYAAAHFATYPKKLVEPCVLAGTSEDGCCSACLAPRSRVVEMEKLTRERPNDYVKRTGEPGTGSSCANSVAGVSVSTIGWRPTCDCDADTVPCTVLDPFGGSGTTAQVALRHGRRAILIELNPEYIDLARRRAEPETPKKRFPLWH